VYICHQWGISGTLCISNFSEEFLVHCVYLSWDQNTKIEKPNDFKVFESMTLKGINKIAINTTVTDIEWSPRLYMSVIPNKNNKKAIT